MGENSSNRWLKTAFDRILVSRAYLNPENAEVKANFRVLPGFMGVFWNLGWMELQIASIYSTYR
jgi:hypothetical protein